MEEKKVIQLSLISGFHFFFSNRIGLITWANLQIHSYILEIQKSNLGNTLQKTLPKMSIPEASTPSLLWRSLRSSKSFSRYSVSSIFPTIFFITPRMYIPCLWMHLVNLSTPSSASSYNRRGLFRPCESLFMGHLLKRVGSSALLLRLKMKNWRFPEKIWVISKENGRVFFQRKWERFSKMMGRIFKENGWDFQR